MAISDIRGVVDQYLCLIRSGTDTPEENVVSLVRTLDALALAMHDVAPAVDKTEHPDPPLWPYECRRALACERFPHLGHYNAAGSVSESPGESDLVVGDAIDDIADIAGDLADAVWRWERTSEADALWHLQESFRYHWGQHLRGLQLYLYCRINGW